MRGDGRPVARQRGGRRVMRCTGKAASRPAPGMPTGPCDAVLYAAHTDFAACQD